MGNSFKSEAIKVLKKSKKPLRIPEIFNGIKKRGNLKTKGHTPESTLHAIISEDIKKRGNWSAFIRIESGLFKFNPNYKEEIKEKKQITKIKEEPREERITLLGQTIKSKGNRIF